MPAHETNGLLDAAASGRDRGRAPRGAEVPTLRDFTNKM